MTSWLTSPHEEFINVDALWSVRFLKEHANRYVFAARYVQDKVVLDVACGVGYGSYHLRRSARKVVAGDVSAEALSSARDCFAAGIEYIRLDAQKLPFVDGAFEVICSFETIEHLQDHVRFLRECSRCLRPGGILLCSTPNKAVSSPGHSGTSSHFHTREFYPSELCELMGRYFPDFELFGQEEWWGQREFRLAKFASALKPIIGKLPGAQYVINAVTRFTLKDYRLASLSTVGLDDLYDNRFTPVPVKITTLAPFVIAVARNQ